MYHAYLLDGKTAQRRAVRVTLGGDCLHIRDSDGYGLDAWSQDGLRLAEEVYAGQPVRLSHRERGDARLTFEDHAILERLRGALPHLRRGYFAAGSTARRVVVWSVGLAALGVALIAGVPHLAKPLARAVPVGWEQALGEVAVASLAGEDSFCSEPRAAAALQHLVSRLATVADGRHDFHVRVTARPEINAFAAPGGHIVIFDGLIQAAASPDEVAGVLAHEMAHVIERHATEGLIRALGFRLVLGLLIGDGSAVVAAVAGVGEHLLVLSHSRKAEAAADRLALELLAAADISGTGLVSFFERLQHESGDQVGFVPEFLSTHPAHTARIDMVRALARERQPALDDDDWQALRGICAGE